MPDDIRTLTSTILTPAQIEALDGAALLDPPSWDAAIIGTRVNAAGHTIAVYAYGKLVDCCIAEAASSGDPEQDHADACEFIEYNTIRALPYAGDRAPVVVTLDEDGNEIAELDEDTSDTGTFDTDA